MIIRKCENCKEDFIPNKKGGKPQKYCKRQCLYSAYRRENIEKTRKTSREWQRKNPDYSKRWRKENPQKIKEYQKKHYYKNKQKRKENSSNWAKKNKVRLRTWKKEYRIKNKEKINNNWNIRYKEFYRNNPNFKLRKNLRNRVRKALLGISCSSKTLELLGVHSIEEIKKYIELQFKTGMTWENYCFIGWHIDHEIPLSSFDLTNPEQRCKAFHYTNLQPMWGIDNLIKGKKIIIK